VVRQQHFLLFMLLAVGAVWPTFLPAQTVAIGCNSIWEVSSRSLPDCPNSNFVPAFDVHLVEQGCWKLGDKSRILGELTDPSRRTVIYVHGNWMDRSEARQRALSVYSKMLRSRCAEDGQPISFILFSWPSERREGFARDVRSKKDRLNADAFYLARFLEQNSATSSLGLIGYSFGGTVVCGALHLLHGGVLDGRRAGLTASASLPTRVSLIAPAFDRTDLAAGGNYSRALDGVERLVNVYNSTDPILKRFRFFDRDAAPIAAGFAGILEPRFGSPLVANEKIQQYDCNTIGRTHAELAYLQCDAASLAMQNVLGL
jgi:hypothetical protein